jgi:hypothetical protein
MSADVFLNVAPVDALCVRAVLSNCSRTGLSPCHLDGLAARATIVYKAVAKPQSAAAASNKSFSCDGKACYKQNVPRFHERLTVALLQTRTEGAAEVQRAGCVNRLQTPLNAKQTEAVNLPGAASARPPYMRFPLTLMAFQF